MRCDVMPQRNRFPTSKSRFELSRVDVHCALSRPSKVTHKAYSTPLTHMRSDRLDGTRLTAGSDEQICSRSASALLCFALTQQRNRSIEPYNAMRCERLYLRVICGISVSHDGCMIASCHQSSTARSFVRSFADVLLSVVFASCLLVLVLVDASNVVNEINTVRTPSAKPRTLILLDDNDIKQSHSAFFAQLTGTQTHTQQSGERKDCCRLADTLVSLLFVCQVVVMS